MLWLGIIRMLCTTFSLEIWLWNGFVHSGSKHVNISLTLIGPCVLAGWEQGRCSLCSDLWKITLWLLFMSPVYYLCTDTCFTFPTLNCGENIFITLVLVAGRIIKFAKIFNKHFNGGGSWHGFSTQLTLCVLFTVFSLTVVTGVECAEHEAAEREGSQLVSLTVQGLQTTGRAQV